MPKVESHPAAIWSLAATILLLTLVAIFLEYNKAGIDLIPDFIGMFVNHVEPTDNPVGLVITVVVANVWIVLLLSLFINYHFGEAGKQAIYELLAKMKNQ